MSLQVGHHNEDITRSTGFQHTQGTSGCHNNGDIMAGCHNEVSTYRGSPNKCLPQLDIRAKDGREREMERTTGWIKDERREEPSRNRVRRGICGETKSGGEGGVWQSEKER